MVLSIQHLNNVKIPIFAIMTITELKNELLGKTYPEPVEISPEQIVVNTDTFLKIQFLEVETWKKDLEKCPAYLRLIKFRDAVKQYK